VAFLIHRRGFYLHFHGRTMNTDNIKAERSEADSTKWQISEFSLNKKLTVAGAALNIQGKSAIASNMSAH